MQRALGFGHFLAPTAPDSTAQPSRLTSLYILRSASDLAQRAKILKPSPKGWVINVVTRRDHCGESGESVFEIIPATEKEEGSIRRACKVLSKRIPFLCGLLGQQMPVLKGEDVCGFWRAVRKLGSTEGILVRLARDFKTSLFRCYRSLRAFWERESPPAATA